jgi:hypothetical protein
MKKLPARQVGGGGEAKAAFSRLQPCRRNSGKKIAGEYLIFFGEKAAEKNFIFRHP